jgi:hypothetical protein
MSGRLPPFAGCSRCKMLNHACYTHSRSAPPSGQPPERPRSPPRDQRREGDFRTGNRGPPRREEPKVQPPPPPPSVDDEEEFPELGAPGPRR